MFTTLEEGVSPMSNQGNGGNGIGAKDRFDVVCLSHLRWGFVFQRPQHLMTRWAEDHRVFYIEEPIETDGEPEMRVEQVAPNVIAAVPHLTKGLSRSSAEEIQRELVEGFLQDRRVSRYILWLYTPMAVPLARRLRPLATVYDCMDELAAFHGAPKELRDHEGELFDGADLVFTGGESLYQEKRERHQNVYLFPSAVDLAHFGKARSQIAEPEDLRTIRRPRIGYAGVIDERIDLELMGAIAKLRPEWQIVMLGPVVKIDPGTLPQGPNIHYLGRKPYEELPGYLSGWDAAILPFARNEATRYISPTKTPEYLAAGLPVVSTSIRDVVHTYGRRGFVGIADRPHDFVAAVEAAMTDREDRDEEVDRFLEGNSWDRTWDRMRHLVEGVISSRFEEPRPLVLSGSDGRPAVIVAPDRAPGTADAPYDYLVAGAGFAGSVIAEHLASAGKRVVIVERRRHIAGNAYDEYNSDGILIHRYGPHIFHTNSAEVFEYLSRFTSWRPYEHRVLASVDGQLVPIPINLDTINSLYGMSLTSPEVEAFLASLAEDVDHV
ncbi:MAG TPA: NAD(P)-binding protein, partial [Actinomycetota bacterium]|nr:NAD(P)-binding protein [Actinomycetota bacterium]